jgi:hypothetical protein
MSVMMDEPIPSGLFPILDRQGALHAMSRARLNRKARELGIEHPDNYLVWRR